MATACARLEPVVEHTEDKIGNLHLIGKTRGKMVGASEGEIYGDSQLFSVGQEGAVQSRIWERMSPDAGRKINISGLVVIVENRK